MSEATTGIEFEGPHGLADFATFIGRARRAQPDGAVRLQRIGGLLVATVAVLEGSGLLGQGTVLGLRVVPVVDADPLDVVVPFAAVADRLARPGATALSVPPMTVHVSWAALSPPRSGWEPVGSIAGEDVDRIATQGIADVAAGTPAGGAGAPAVHELRQGVWGAMSETTPPFVAGLAFGAHLLGFIGAGLPAALAANGRWSRLSTSRGHVLAR